MEVIRTGHNAILVENIEESVKFYTENFGFEEGLIAEDWAIVRKNGDDIAFIKKGVSQHPPHFGLRVKSNEDVDDAYEKIKAHNKNIERT
jgi:extradiol dioxygenase family protein